MSPLEEAAVQTARDLADIESQINLWTEHDEPYESAEALKAIKDRIAEQRQRLIRADKLQNAGDNVVALRPMGEAFTQETRVL